ncbi:MAG: hypothetical protein AAGA57_01575 [Planctomycetota bacterium]
MRALPLWLGLIVCLTACQTTPPNAPETQTADTPDPDIAWLASYDIHQQQPPLISADQFASTPGRYCGPAQAPTPWPENQPKPSILLRNLGDQPVVLSQQDSDWTDALAPGQTRSFGHRPGLTIGDAAIRCRHQPIGIENLSTDPHRFLTLRYPNTYLRRQTIVEFGGRATMRFDYNSPVLLETHNLLLVVR